MVSEYTLKDEQRCILTNFKKNRLELKEILLVKHQQKKKKKIEINNTYSVSNEDLRRLHKMNLVKGECHKSLQKQTLL